MASEASNVDKLAERAGKRDVTLEGASGLARL